MPSAADAEKAQQDRRAQVERILSSLALNPYDVLGLRTDSTLNEVRRQHRQLSLSVHPDRFSGDAVPRAQLAFSLITAAKNALLDDTARALLAALIATARAAVTDAMNRAECARRGYAVPPACDAAALATIIAERTAQPGAEPFPAWPQRPDFETRVGAALRELLVDADFRRQQDAREAARHELEAAQTREKRRADEAMVKEREKDWEEHRDERVSAWRQFSAQGAGKRFFKPPAAKGDRARTTTGGLARGGGAVARKDDLDEWA
jgi:DnaJ family protein C protein 8